MKQTSSFLVLDRSHVVIVFGYVWICPLNISMWERWDTHEWCQHRKGGAEETEGERKGASLEALRGKQSARERKREWWKVEEQGSLWGKHNGSCDLWRWTSDPQKPAGGHRFRLLPAARLLQHTSPHTVGIQRTLRSNMSWQTSHSTDGEPERSNAAVIDRL